MLWLRINVHLLEVLFYNLILNYRLTFFWNEKLIFYFNRWFFIFIHRIRYLIMAVVALKSLKETKMKLGKEKIL